MSIDHEQAFRFLDLPIELRLMVYERLIVRRHEQVALEITRAGAPCVLNPLILILNDPIPPIHLTCRTVCEEVVPFLKPLVETASIPRILAYTKDYSTLDTDESDLVVGLERVFGHMTLCRMGLFKTPEELWTRIKDMSQILLGNRTRFRESDVGALFEFSTTAAKHMWPDVDPKHKLGVGDGMADKAHPVQLTVCGSISAQRSGSDLT